jgi:hypothetical protein
MTEGSAARPGSPGRRYLEDAPGSGERCWLGRDSWSNDSWQGGRLQIPEAGMLAVGWLGEGFTSSDLPSLDRSGPR